MKLTKSKLKQIIKEEVQKVQEDMQAMRAGVAEDELETYLSLALEAGRSVKGVADDLKHRGALLDQAYVRMGYEGNEYTPIGRYNETEQAKAVADNFIEPKHTSEAKKQYYLVNNYLAFGDAKAGNVRHFLSQLERNVYGLAQRLGDRTTMSDV